MKASRKMSLRTRFIVLLPWDGKSYLVWSTGERNRCRKAHILITPSSSSPNTPQNWTKFPPTLSGVRRVHMMIEYKSAEVSLSQARDSPPKLPTYTPGFEWTSRIQLQPSWKSGRSPRYIDIDTGIQPCRYRDIHRKRERERKGGREREMLHNKTLTVTFMPVARYQEGKCLRIFFKKSSRELPVLHSSLDVQPFQYQP